MDTGLCVSCCTVMMKFVGHIGWCRDWTCDFSKHQTLLSFYTFMPRSSTTSLFCCQTLSSPLELLEFKAAARFKQSAVWDSGCSQIQSEHFCIVGKPKIRQRLPLSASVPEWNFCCFAQTWSVWLSSSFASYKIISSSFSVSHPWFVSPT